MKKAVLVLSIMNFCSAAKSQQVSFSIQAHQDDWQLFMSRAIVNDLSTNAKCVFITFTGGDAGQGAGGGSGTVPYFQARENGSVYSAKFAQDLSGRPERLPVGTFKTITYRNSANLSVSHKVMKYVYRNTVNYFFRLPDGNPAGTGYVSTGNQSLKMLKEGKINSITAIDRSATYLSWTDLVNTVRKIILEEKGNDDQVWINTPSLDIDKNAGDHADHSFASVAAREAVADLPWVGIAGWINYASSSMSSNLNVAQHENASAIFGMCVWGLVEAGYETNFNSTHNGWLPMDHNIIERSPSGTSRTGDFQDAVPEKNPGFNGNGIKQVPLIVSVNNPVSLSESINLVTKYSEGGVLRIEILDYPNGSLIYGINEQVLSGENKFIFKCPATGRGIVVLRVTLNNVYQESRFIILL